MIERTSSRSFVWIFAARFLCAIFHLFIVLVVITFKKFFLHVAPFTTLTSI